MRICFPVTENLGLESPVFEHFGSAPMFLLVDVDSGDISEQKNLDLGHGHGQCQPLKALAGQSVDAIVVGGIGRGALAGLKRSGLKVFQALTGTVADSLNAVQTGKLTEMTLDQVCGGHGNQQRQGQGRGHRHGSSCCS